IERDGEVVVRWRDGSTQEAVVVDDDVAGLQRGCPCRPGRDGEQQDGRGRETEAHDALLSGGKQEESLTFGDAHKGQNARIASGQLCRRATSGSTRDARRAGTNDAASVTAASRPIAAAIVAGSAGARPNSIDDTRRDAAQAAG